MRYFVKDTGFYCHKAETESDTDANKLLNFGWEEISKDTYNNTVPYNSQSESTESVLLAENKLLKAQLQAQTERSDFIEDCIAEMATQVYGGV